MDDKSLSVAFDRYYTYDELTDIIAGLSQQHEDTVQMRSIGESYEGRSIWAVTVTDRTCGDPADKPAYYIDANHHAGEVTGSMTALYIIVYLVERAGHDTGVDRLLRDFTFYVIPRVSPDGSERYLNTPDMLRSSVRPWPARRGESEDGLHPEDVDDNGVILQMRIRSEHGAWRISDRDPRLMILREPGEEDGPFYDLYPEGRMREYDGTRVHAASPRWGLDFNRNFPHEWGTEREQRGAGPHPLSEPETHAIARFISDHPNISVATTYHTTGGILLRPPCRTPDGEMDLVDLQLHQILGDIGQRLTGYRCASVYDEMTLNKKRPTRGSFLDFVYESRGMLAYAPELWNLQERAGVPTLSPQERFMRSRAEREDDDLKVLQWIDEHCPDRIHPWKSFTHPQFGEVEIGGVDTKFVRQNPPPQFLEQECKKQLDWSMVKAASLPRISIDDFTVEQVSDGLYLIEAAVINEGWLATHVTSVGRELVDPPEYVLCLPEDATLVAGERRGEVGHLEGSNAALNSPVPDRARRLQWMLRYQGDPIEISLQVSGDRCGRVVRDISLPGGER